MAMLLMTDRRHTDADCSVLKVLELVGTTTLEDSLQCCNQRGIVCMTGMVGNKWALENFSPMESIPQEVYLTKYSGKHEMQGYQM